MSNTELITIVLPPAVANPPAVDDYERTTPLPCDVESEQPNGLGREQGLASIDGGFAAWRLLCAAFMFEALLWGRQTD